MKKTELKLIAELLKNSHRSDRDLAKAVGVSQPSISRARIKLEREGYIKEYTIIPDFCKLGFSMCVFTFAKFKLPSDLTKMRELIAKYGERLEEIPQAVLIERGMGENAEGIVVSFHESYSDHMKFQEWLKQFSDVSMYDLHSFIVNLEDNVHFRYLTFQTLAKYLQDKKQTEKEQ